MSLQPPSLSQRQSPVEPFSRAHACYQISAAKHANGGSLVSDALELILASLVSHHHGLECTGASGLNTFYGDGVMVRTVADVAGELFAVEVVDLHLQDRWEAYFMQLPDYSFRSGWSRQCAGPCSEPADWLEAVAHFSLGEQVEPHLQPDFLAIAGAFSSAAGIQVATTDAPARAALAVEARMLRETTAKQAAQLRVLKSGLLDASVRQDSGPTPTAYVRLDQVGEWAAENADRIIVLPRVISECRKALYDNPGLFYQSLELLAVTYRDVRMNNQPRERLIEHATELGLSIGGSVEPSRATEEYFFRWDGRRCFLDQHLGRGNSRDPRHCLRLYFYWAESLQMVILGAGPSHLGNSMS